MAKLATAFFFWLQNLCVLLVLLRPSKIPLRPDAISPQLEPENIRESILDFTVHFGEINPDRFYLVDEVSRASPKDVLPLSPLFGKS